MEAWNAATAAEQHSFIKSGAKNSTKGFSLFLPGFGKGLVEGVVKPKLILHPFTSQHFENGGSADSFEAMQVF